MKQEFDRLVAERYSCRSYKPVAPGRGILLEVLESARMAPSACNRQPWKFILIDRPDDTAGRDAVARSYSRAWIETAPAYIIACGIPSQAWVRPFDNVNHTLVDLSIAVEHICLSATAHSLGTCWVCNFDPEILKSGLGLGEELLPVAIIPIGYPADTEPEKKRKTPEEIIECRD